MGPRAGLDGCRKSRTNQDLIPRPSSPQRVAISTELSQPTLIVVVLFEMCLSFLFQSLLDILG